MDSNERVIAEIKANYDADAQLEWDRIEGRPEFFITCHYMDRYIRPGQRVLDIGGGPGRYALYLAAKGCDVTLLDLSGSNVAFARAKAAGLGLPLTAIAGDARLADELAEGEFDHVLLMGPLYHLLEEAGRVRAVEAALAKLKPGGTLWATFISWLAGIIFAMREQRDAVADAAEQDFIACLKEGRSYTGMGFTHVHMPLLGEVEAFMARFGLEKLHLLSQEGITASHEADILALPTELRDEWMALNLAMCEHPEVLSWAEHFLYIARKGEGRHGDIQGT